MTTSDATTIMVAIARLEERVIRVQEDLKEINGIVARVDSLETSRTWAKATLATMWTILVFLGWAWISDFFGINGTPDISPWPDNAAPPPLQGPFPPK